MDYYTSENVSKVLILQGLCHFSQAFWYKKKTSKNFFLKVWFLQNFFCNMCCFAIWRRIMDFVKNTLSAFVKWQQLLFKLGVFFAILNCIYLSFIQIHVVFYFNYIIYSSLLIFRCQNVARLYYSKFPRIDNTFSKYHAIESRSRRYMYKLSHKSYYI